jgi:hypothetical protein
MSSGRKIGTGEIIGQKLGRIFDVDWVSIG